MIKAIKRAAGALDCLSEGAGNLTEISSKMKLSLATTYRLLKSLEELGLVVKDTESNRYFLGHRLLSLAANPAIAHQGLVACAYEEMERLRQVSEETVALYIQQGIKRVCLEELQSPHHITYTAGRGYAAPVYTGAGGRVILAQVGIKELETILKNITIIPKTSRSIMDKDQLKEEVKKAARQGYAVTVGEVVPGAIGIAVPIKDYVCPVALLVIGPENRLVSRRALMIKEMKRSADLISTKLMAKLPG